MMLLFIIFPFSSINLTNIINTDQSRYACKFYHKKEYRHLIHFLCPTKNVSSTKQMTTFSLSLNSKNDVFFPNSEVNGTLKLITNEPNKITRIYIEVIGCARTYFDESDGHSTIPYWEEQFYMNHNIILWPNECNELSTDGVNQFPFKFVIPSDVAPNISEDLGEIQYYVKGVVEFPPKFFGTKNLIKYYGFSVCPIFDLNLDPKLNLAAYTTVTQIQQKCFSCVKNPLEVKMRLPKTGYVCGEVISLRIDISNKTSMKIQSIDLGISLKGFITATYRSKWFECDTVTKTKETKTNVVITNVKPTSNSAVYSFVIPPLSPSYSGCSFLQFQYYVFIKVHTDAFFQAGPSTSIPITIGNIPIMKETECDATKILETAEFFEGKARCKIRERYCNEKKDGPKEFQPKYACYSDLPSSEKSSSE